MNVEHASEKLIGRYARGETGIAGDELWALEAHLESCATCRGRLSAVVGRQVPAVASLIEDVWAELGSRLAGVAPAPPRRRWGRMPVTWMTPVMAPWLGMTVSIALLALVLDRMKTGPFGDDFSLVLLMAPVLPVLGVAVSWARGLDPAYELTTSTPRAGLHLVLRRTTSVLVVVIPTLLVAGWATGVMVAQWLLPCLAFTTGTLALGGLVGMTRAAVVLVAAWAAVIVAPAVAAGHTSFALRTDGLPVWGAVFALGIAVMVARKETYTRFGADI